MHEYDRLKNTTPGTGIGLAEMGMAAMAQGAPNACGEDRQRFIRASVEVPADAGFTVALGAAMNGCRITRAGWNAGGQHVEAQYPDKGSRMSAPYLVLKNAQNELVPWVPSQGDLFARDWAVLPR